MKQPDKHTINREPTIQVGGYVEVMVLEQIQSLRVTSIDGCMVTGVILGREHIVLAKDCKPVKSPKLYAP